MVNNKLTNLSAEGKASELIYIDVAEYAQAYGINGRYMVEGDKIHVQGKVFFEDKAIVDIDIQGKVSKKAELVEKIIDTAFRYIQNK